MVGVIVYLAESGATAHGADGRMVRTANDNGYNKIMEDKMNVIEIHSQTELDALPMQFEQQTLIVINAPHNVPIYLRCNRKNANMNIRGLSFVDTISDGVIVGVMRESAQVGVMRGSAQVGEMWGSAQVGVMRGSAQVREMWESAQVREMWESAQVGVMRESAQVRVMRESAQVRVMRESAQVGVMRGSAQVREMWESAQVRVMRESAQVRVMRESAQVGEMRESAQVRVMRESAQVGEMRESAQVGEMRESAQVGEMWESAQVGVMRGSAQVREMWGSAQVRGAYENAQIICKSEKCEISSYHNAIITLQDCDFVFSHKSSVPIIKTKTYAHDIKSFCDIYPPKRKLITLYKSVDPATHCDFYTGKICYKIGSTIVCPDFDPDDKRQCGGGLHLSPTPNMALNYNKGKLLICHVHVDDIVVFSSDISKVRCRKVKVVGEYTE